MAPQLGKKKKELVDESNVWINFPCQNKVEKSIDRNIFAKKMLFKHSRAPFQGFQFSSIQSLSCV